MKPTEADIQAELIEGWEIDEYFSPVKNKLRIRKDTLKIAFYDFTFEIALNDSERSGTLRFFSFESFITGNYGLSAISQHYEPEEWQRIITMCERIVRLITGEQVEQSLEEKVREILHDVNVKPEITYIHDDEVSVCNRHHQYWIRADKVTYSNPNGEQREQTHQAYAVSGLYHKEFKAIAALLATRSTKPSYSDLEQRVEELEAKLKSCERKYRGRMQELQQVREDYTNCSSVYGQKIEKLQEQLDGAVSEADHEREMEAWKTAFEAQRADLLKHIGLSKQYENWWKSEYAKNAEASQ